MTTKIKMLQGQEVQGVTYVPWDVVVFDADALAMDIVSSGMASLSYDASNKNHSDELVKISQEQ